MPSNEEAKHRYDRWVTDPEKAVWLEEIRQHVRVVAALENDPLLHRLVQEPPDRPYRAPLYALYNNSLAMWWGKRMSASAVAELLMRLCVGRGADCHYAPLVHTLIHRGWGEWSA